MYTLPQTQPRTNDGRYSHAERSESPVSLQLPARDYNADGTFEFPPIARDAEQLVDFWMRVPVPDQVLHQLRAEYHAAQYQARADEIAQIPEPEKFSHGQVSREWDAWFTRVNELEVEMTRQHPAAISQVLARPLARASMLVRQAQTLEDAKPGITEEVRSLPMDLSILGNPTIGSLLDMYPTLDLPEQTWSDQRAEYGAVAADKLEELIDLMRGDDQPGT
ncbi:hypothetical protein [Cellulosimicrobium sp. Marseille-Q4280]|uniref:hypothetical protein n=1 Tax=Cellulosimicrobium sp. Marseille-Q4280 TaxID=2937992 RepID=UPI00203E65D2|nr:hypothetical protein [Cellulosimicrobium sp. Marseille-Q4280]